MPAAADRESDSAAAVPAGAYRAHVVENLRLGVTSPHRTYPSGPSVRTGAPGSPFAGLTSEPNAGPSVRVSGPFVRVSGAFVRPFAPFGQRDLLTILQI